MASINLEPVPKSAVKMFLQAQLRTKPKPPPAGTSFAGQTAIITGSNVGLGLECARQMLDLDLSYLILAVRSKEKGEAAAAPLRKARPEATIDVWLLDMASYRSIQDFAARCSGLARLDIAILNAGVSMLDFIIIPETGHETTLQINYLSTALLAILLVPIMKAKKQGTAPGRLSIVSSGLALTSAFPNRDAVPLLSSFDEQPKNWNLVTVSERYAVSKTLTLMLTQKLSECVAGEDVVVTAVDPGMTSGTTLGRNMPRSVQVIVGLIQRMTARSVEQGAWTYIDAVLRGKEAHGGFAMNWDILPFHEMMYTANGKKTTERLWDETLQELEFANARMILEGSR